MERRGFLKGAGAASLAASGFAPALAQISGLGRWRRAESANFIIFSPDAEMEIRKQAASLEAFHTLLTRLSPSTQPNVQRKLPIYYAKTQRDFEMIGPDMGDTVGGFYETTVEDIRAVVASFAGRGSSGAVGMRDFDAQLILFHEYTHHYQRANARWALPKWYIEGQADYFSTVEFKPDGCHIGKATPARAAWLDADQWLPIELLLSNSPKLTEQDNARFYAQAWLATHMIMLNADRAKGFDLYVRALSDGGDPIKSFEPAFGISPAAFDRELRAYKGKRMTVRVLADARVDLAIPLQIEQLPASADNLLMHGAYARTVPPSENADRTLRSIRDQASRSPDDFFAKRTLAMAEIWCGDLAVARKLLEALAVADPKDAETQHLIGLTDLRAGYAANDPASIARSQSSFMRAFQLDKTRASSLFRLVEARARAPGGVDASSLEILIAAWQICPQIGPLSLVLAQALIKFNRHDEAVVALRSLTTRSHGQESGLLKKLMTAAQTKSAPPLFTWVSSARTGEESAEEELG